MTIADIKTQLIEATHPVAKALHRGVHFKVLLIGFNKGMSLKEHKAHQPTKLTVLEGSVVYKEADKTLIMPQYSEVEIPVNALHSIEALEHSICLLTQG